MNWRKRTAALAVSLLLLSTIAYAQAVGKASAPEDRADLDVRLVSPRETTRPAKLAELPVMAPEEAGPAKPIVVEPVSPGSPGLAAPPEPETAERAVVIPDPSARVEAPEYEAPAAVTPAAPDGPVFPEAEDWQLLLVNPWNEMPEDYEVHLKSMPDGMKVDEKAYDSLTAMLQACQDAGLHPKICSAYRTMAKQTYLYNNKIARLQNAGYSKKAAQAEAGRWVARPGTSEHQLGLAVDIVSQSYQALTKKQERTAEQKWLMEHCWEYGFILRYPNEKSEITGIGYEPWHYRYVGRDVALDIRDSGLCMEEYLLLREETLAAENRA